MERRVKPNRNGSPRPRFAVGLVIGLLLGLAIAITGWVGLQLQKHWTRGERVEAVLGVSPQEPLLPSKGNTAESPEDFKLRQQQLADLITSPYILNEVLSDPKISQLKIIRQRSNPQRFLEDRVYVRLLPNRNFLYVGMEASPGNATQTTQVVDEIVRQTLAHIREEESSRFDGKMASLMEQANNLKSELRSLAKDQRSMQEQPTASGSLDLAFLEKENAIVNDALEEVTRAILTARIENRRPPTVRSLGKAQLVE